MADPKPKRTSRSSSSKKPAAKKTTAPSARKAGTPKPLAKATATKAAVEKKESAKVGASRGSAKKPAAKPAPDLPARIDGLRGWLDQIERRQSRMTYIVTAGLLIAFAIAGVALYLGITANQDLVKKSDLDAVKASISKASADTEAKVTAQVKQVDTRIDSLQSQVTDAQAAAQQAQQAAAKKPSFSPAPVTPPTSPTQGGTGK
jgi:hypothetical protein